MRLTGCLISVSTKRGKVQIDLTHTPGVWRETPALLLPAFSSSHSSRMSVPPSLNSGVSTSSRRI